MTTNWKSICYFMYYYGIGCGVGSAIKNSNTSTLFLTILVLFIGIIWIFPVFLPEEKQNLED